MNVVGIALTYHPAEIEHLEQELSRAQAGKTNS